MYYSGNKLYYSTGVMLPSELELAAKIHSVNIQVLGLEMDWQSVSASLGTGSHPDPIVSNTFNTYGDFHLIPSQMPIIAPKEPLTSYVTVPGSSVGDIDMSTALTGKMLYKNREGSWSFMYENTWRCGCPEHNGVQRSIVIGNKTYTASGYLSPFQIQRILEKYIHGRLVLVSLMDDPETRYRGRIWVESMTPGEESNGTVVFKYKLEPDPV